MVEIAILSDTHVPSRVAAVPDWIIDEIERADVVIHAGDFDARETLDVIEAAADRLVAVRGNADPDLDLPTAATLEVGGVTFVITHGSGSLDGYRDRVLETVRAHDAGAIGVSGHSHREMDVSVDGTRLLNPGSATGVPPAESATMMRCTVADGVADVTSVEGP